MLFTIALSVPSYSQEEVTKAFSQKEYNDPHEMLSRDLDVIVALDIHQDSQYRTAVFTSIMAIKAIMKQCKRHMAKRSQRQRSQEGLHCIQQPYFRVHQVHKVFQQRSSQRLQTHIHLFKYICAISDQFQYLRPQAVHSFWSELHLQLILDLCRGRALQDVLCYDVRQTYISSPSTPCSQPCLKQICLLSLKHARSIWKHAHFETSSHVPRTYSPQSWEFIC